MDETNNIYLVREQLANVAMVNLLDETRKLVDKFGVEGAKRYIRAQLHFVEQIAQLEGSGDDEF